MHHVLTLHELVLVGGEPVWLQLVVGEEWENTTGPKIARPQ